MSDRDYKVGEIADALKMLIDLHREGTPPSLDEEMYTTTVGLTKSLRIAAFHSSEK